MHNIDALLELLIVDDPVEPLEAQSLCKIPHTSIKPVEKSIIRGLPGFLLHSRSLAITAFAEEEFCGRVKGKTKEDGLNIHR